MIARVASVAGVTRVPRVIVIVGREAVDAKVIAVARVTCIVVSVVVEAVVVTVFVDEVLEEAIGLSIDLPVGVTIVSAVVELDARAACLFIDFEPRSY